MASFEIPYNFNFDGQYFGGDGKNFHGLHSIPKEKIDSIYLPAWKEDAITTRFSIGHMPKTLDEYRQHLSNLRDQGYPLSVLFQRNADFEKIKSYIEDYGVTGFTLNDDFLAARIKDKYGDQVNLKKSLTSKLMPEDIKNGDYSMYDNICLWFWYNRHINDLKKLPDKYNYTILVNSFCLWNCPYTEEHWFGEEALKIPPCIVNGAMVLRQKLENNCYILPKDLPLFEPYVSVFKFEGREKSSKIIFNDINKVISTQTNV